MLKRMTALRLALLALLGLALFNAPLLPIAAARGPMAEMAYLFGVWGVLLAAAALVVRKGERVG